MQSNYSLSLNFGDLIRKREAATCDLAESVKQHIFLILITRFGEFSYDMSYGCELWEYDFDNPADIDAQKHRLEKLIKTTIELHEPRLSRVTIKVVIDTQEFTGRLNKKQPRIKKKIAITVKGVLKETNQEFQPQAPYIIYFSPISVQQ